MSESGTSFRVWATRPQDQNGSWKRELEDEGFTTVDLPFLAIEPVSDAAAVQAVKNVILDFDQFNKVIFVSQNAVREAFVWLRRYWPQLPMGIAYFAVGKKTANTVLAEGVGVIAAQSAMNSEEMLALPQLQKVWGEKILICRGQGGLPHLGEVLHERGAIVRYAELYQRLLPPHLAEQIQPLLPLTAYDVMPFFSGETLKNYVAALDANGVAERVTPVIVPGKRVAQLAEELGFKHIVMAANATTQEMLKAVAELLGAYNANAEPTARN